MTNFINRSTDAARQITNEQNKWIKLGIAVKDRIWIQQRYIYVSELLYIERTCNCASTKQHHWNNGYDERTQNNIIEIMDMMKEQTRKVWNTMILIFMLTNLSKLNISHSLRYVTNEGSFKRHHEIMIKLFLVMKWFFRKNRFTIYEVQIKCLYISGKEMSNKDVQKKNYSLKF